MEERRELPAPVRIDIRQLGGVVDPEHEDEAILANPRAAYFPSVGPDQGYEYGRYGAVVCHVPYTLHRDYGGELLDDQIRERLIVHVANGEYPIIRWAGVIPEWVSIISYAGYATLTWYPENPDYTFNIYWSLYLEHDFSLLTNVNPATYGDNSYNVTGLTPGITYYFYITAVSSAGIESPKSVTRGVKVK